MIAALPVSSKAVRVKTVRSGPKRSHRVYPPGIINIVVRMCIARLGIALKRTNASAMAAATVTVTAAAEIN